MATELRPVGLDFFDSAPYHFVASEVVHRPAKAIFNAIACDPAGWGSWFPGFSHQGRYLTPLPQGVGSKREVVVGGVHFIETVLAWEEPGSAAHPHLGRWAFFLEQAGLPLATALAEDYRVLDQDDHALVQWTFAFEPRPPIDRAARLGKLIIPFIWRRAMTRLDRRLATTP